MAAKITEIAKSFKFQLFIISVLFFFLYRALFLPSESIAVHIVNEALVLFMAYMLGLNMISMLSTRKLKTTGYVNGITIAAVIVFLSLMFREIFPVSIIEADIGNRLSPGFFGDLINSIYTFSLFIAFMYILISLRMLYFTKKGKHVKTFYNALLLFFLLAAATSLFKMHAKGLEFIYITFFINSIVLITINSLSISWIAFLSKKQKLQMLLLSVVLIGISAVSFGLSLDNQAHKAIVFSFSYGMNTFFVLMSLYIMIYFGVLFFTALFHLPTAEAYDKKAKEVSSLQYFSKFTNQVLDFEELAETVTELSLDFSGADAAWIVMEEDDTKTPIAPNKIGYMEASSLYKLLGDADQSSKKKSITIYEFSGSSKVSVEKAGGFRQIAVVPLKTYNKLSGCLYIAKKNESPFDDDEISAIETFSDYSAIAIENSRLLQESIEKERLERELDVARAMQQKLLPQELPNVEELEISCVFIPAFEVGGDYYDFFPREDGSIGFTIADVSGKGITAAFIMAELRGIFGSLTTMKKNPKEVLYLSNSNLWRTLDSKSFVTALFGNIDSKSGILTLARAGHVPALLIRDNQITEITPQGLALGMNYEKFFEEALEEVTLQLQENDLLVLFTDGVTEAQNAKRQEFGREALKRIILQTADKPVDIIAKKILEEITVFSEESPQHDDITMVILRWKSKQINGDNNG